MDDEKRTDLDNAKRTYREAEEKVKKAWRDRDGEDVADKVGNAGDEARKRLGNLGDDLDRRNERPIDDPDATPAGSNRPF